jgi:hypothetical protein
MTTVDDPTLHPTIGSKSNQSVKKKPLTGGGGTKENEVEVVCIRGCMRS